MIILYSFLMPFSLCYFIFFILVSLWPVEAAPFKSLIFYETPWLPFVILVAFGASSFKLGCNHIKEVAEYNKRKCLSEVEQQKVRLVEFIKLARLILNEDGEKIIQEYIERVEKNYNLKDKADE